MATIFITQGDTDATLEKFANALETMKKYPKEYKRFKTEVTRLQENFGKLAKII